MISVTGLGALKRCKLSGSEALLESVLIRGTFGISIIVASQVAFGGSGDGPAMREDGQGVVEWDGQDWEVE